MIAAKQATSTIPIVFVKARAVLTVVPSRRESEKPSAHPRWPKACQGCGQDVRRPRIDAKLESRIRERLRAGDGMLKIAKEVGVGSGTVQRIAKDMLRPFVTAV
jgi:hypothetical protein